ncbi:Peptidase [Vibrio crassostreae]|nr:conserved membrane hypothetical protein [Vibrio chagasii]CAK2859277.1 Peptidase [Vibrio crassostreae]
MAAGIIETLTELLTSAGVFLGFVFFLYFLQVLACGLAMRQFGGKGIYLSAIVGTPVHEISHAIMCLPFRHKIDHIALFKPDGCGTLGYVSHSYNPSSLWQEIGNFFIGVAPLFGGTATIYLLTFLLLPNSQDIFQTIQVSVETYKGVAGVISFFGALYAALTELASVLFVSAQAEPFLFALWVYLTASVSLHLSPSPVDMKGSVKGFILIVLVIAGLRYISYSTGEALFDRLGGIFLSLSVTYSLCILLAAGMAVILFVLSLISPKIQGN